MSTFDEQNWAVSVSAINYDMVAFLHLHGSRPVGGEHGTEVAWRYSYQVIPPGGPAADTAG